MSKVPCFISGPFRGPNHWAIHENIRNAAALALAAWRSRRFSWVYCPHLNTAPFQDAAPDEVWIEGHLAALRDIHSLGGIVICTAGGWVYSSGTRGELAWAAEACMPCFEATDNIDDPRELVMAHSLVRVGPDNWETRCSRLRDWLGSHK